MTDIWKELDLDRWTWEVPRDTPGPYVAEHIPKPLITDWVKKWKPIINEALEKAEKSDRYAKIADRDIKALNNSLRVYEEKLEAVKKWYSQGPVKATAEYNPNWEYSMMRWLHKLKKILEGEQSSEVRQT